MLTIRVLLLLIVVAVAASAANIVSAVGPRTAEALSATDYMRTLQNADGGFPAFASGSDAGATIDASFAFVAVGIDPKTVTNQGKSPADYLAAKAGSYSTTPGGAAKLVLGLAAMRLDTNSFAGLDPLAVMETNYNAASGAYGTDTFAQSLFILAEASLGRPESGAAVTYLESLQSSSDGGFPFSAPGDSDTNSAALALQALSAAKVAPSDSHITAALTYLHASQSASGGFPFTAPGDADPNSTALVIQAIVAAAQSPEDSSWSKDGKSALSALLAFQNPSTGALQYSGVDNALATYQGVPGLMLAPLPLVLSATQTSTPTPSPSSTPTPVPLVTSTSAPSTRGTATATATPPPSSPARLPATGGAASGGGSDYMAFALIGLGAWLVLAASLSRWWLGKDRRWPRNR